MFNINTVSCTKMPVSTTRASFTFQNCRLDSAEEVSKLGMDRFRENLLCEAEVLNLAKSYSNAGMCTEFERILAYAKRNG